MLVVRRREKLVWKETGSSIKPTRSFPRSSQEAFHFYQDLSSGDFDT
jgi:hypothetical protein